MKFLTAPLRTIVILLLALGTGYFLTMIGLNLLSGFGLPGGLEYMIFWFVATLLSAFVWQKVLPKPARK